MGPKRDPNVDWEAVEREYRAGQLSNVEIARRYGTKESTIRKYARVDGWEKDLTARVREAVRAKAIRDSLRDPATDAAIVEQAAERGAEVIRLQREDIAKLRGIESRLLAELDDTPKKLYVAQYQGSIIEKELKLTVAERAAALRDLSTVQHKRIALERQAYNLDEESDVTVLIEVD